MTLIATPLKPNAIKIESNSNTRITPGITENDELREINNEQLIDGFTTALATPLKPNAVQNESNFKGLITHRPDLTDDNEQIEVNEKQHSHNSPTPIATPLDLNSAALVIPVIADDNELREVDDEQNSDNFKMPITTPLNIYSIESKTQSKDLLHDHNFGSSGGVSSEHSVNNVDSSATDQNTDRVSIKSEPIDEHSPEDLHPYNTRRKRLRVDKSITKPNVQLKGKRKEKAKTKQTHSKEKAKANEQAHSNEIDWKCNKCNKTFDKRGKLNQHLKLHVKTLCCDICGILFSSPFNLKRHLDTHYGVTKYKCSVCHLPFRYSVTLRKHKLVTNHYTTEELEDPISKQCITCEYCGRQYPDGNYSMYRRHVRTHTGEKPYKCKLCNKTFSDNSNLYNHTKRHRGDKPFNCELCGKGFIYQTLLERHLKSSVHVEKNSELKIKREQAKKIEYSKKNFVCTTCGKRFGNNRNLKRHMRFHSDVKQYCCDICGKGFHLSSGLSRHIAMHNDVRKFKCSVCQVTFRQSLSLRNHKLKNDHYTADEKKTETDATKSKQCEYCDKKFPTNSLYQKHVRIHTGEKPYACPHCDRAYSDKSNLRSHIKNHSKNKPNKCDLCDKQFLYPKMLAKHLLNHSKTKSENEKKEEPNCSTKQRSSTRKKKHTKMGVQPIVEEDVNTPSSQQNERPKTVNVEDLNEDESLGDFTIELNHVMNDGDSPISNNVYQMASTSLTDPVLSGVGETLAVFTEEAPGQNYKNILIFQSLPPSSTTIPK